MSVAVVLPARLESTRLREKLLLNRTGRTLLEHTLERAKEAQHAQPGAVTTVLVACDDPRLSEAAGRAGVRAVLTRKDHPSGTDRIAEAAEGLNEDLIVNLQADEPELEPELILRLVELMAAAPAQRFPVGTLCAPIYDEAAFQAPNVVKVILDGFDARRSWHRALYFSRAPIPFVRDTAPTPDGWTMSDPSGASRRVLGWHHIGMYAYRREFLKTFCALPPASLEKREKLEQLRVLENGYEMAVAVCHAHPPGIDTPEDYEAFVSRWNSKHQEPRAKS